MLHHLAPSIVLLATMTGCVSTSTRRPDADAGHQAFVAFVAYLGGVNEQLQEEVASDGYDSLVASVTCDDARFERDLTALQAKLVDHQYSATEATLLVEGIRHFRRDGVCG